jgi:hypothetical protein
VHPKQAQAPAAESSALLWPGILHKSGSQRRSPAPPRPLLCAGAAHRIRQVVLCHQSLRDLEWRGNLSENRYVGRTIWDSTPTATLVTDASMEGWGAEIHTSRHAAGTQQPVALSVPARFLFTPDDAESRSINQRELLAAILGLQKFLPVARDAHVQLVSNSHVTLAGTRNWASRSPRMMVLLRILRKL